MSEIVHYLTQLATTVGLKLLYALLILVVGFKLTKVLTKSIEKSKGFAKIDVTVRSFLKSFLRIALKILVVITAAMTLGIPGSTFITMIASAGVAIGLALQGSLSNLAGGIMLLLFKPFKVGDFIENGAYSGVVESISIFYTVIVTGDNKTVTLPNGALTNSTVVNYNGKSDRRVDLTFSVAYDSDIEKVKALLLAECDKLPQIKKDPAPFTRLSAHSDSSLDFVLRVWVDAGDYWTTYFDLTENVKKAFDENGVEIPYPHMDIKINKE